jgi:hypothetical protein
MDDAACPPFYAESTGIKGRITRWQDIRRTHRRGPAARPDGRVVDMDDDGADPQGDGPRRRQGHY